jgi:hypothetical protein
MRIFLVFCIVTLGLVNAAFGVNGMIVPGATEEGIRNDCRVTAELSVKLLKMKAKLTPEQLRQTAHTLLTIKGYKGSFGPIDFIAYFYTGAALQMGTDVDPIMAGVTPEDLANMENEHETSCLDEAFKN